MKDNNYKKRAIKRLFFSLMILIIYILGTRLAIPGVNSQGLLKMLSRSPNMSLLMSMTGLSLDRMSLLSLGLGPWMSSLIIWRVLSVTKLFHIQNMTDRQSYTFRFLIAMALGIVQSLTIVSQIQQTGGDQGHVRTWQIILILIAGLAILIWLGNLNMKYGIGGATIIILLSMTRLWPAQVFTQTQALVHSPSSIPFWLIGLVLGLILSYIVFHFFQGERRVPLMHVMLDNSLAQESYLPIPTNPAGGMPFMFAFSVMLFPQYIFFLLEQNFPKNHFIQSLGAQVQLDHLLGIGIFILVLVLLTFGFAYVNIDYQEIAKSLKESGDYFLNVYPGKNTERYLFHKTTIMATVSAVLNVLIVGIPMFLALIFPNLAAPAHFIPTWLIFLILMKEIVLQFRYHYHRNDYEALI